MKNSVLNLKRFKVLYLFISFFIPLSLSAQSISLFNTADGSTANPNDLVLFRTLYTYTATGPMTITATLPTGTTLAAATGVISPGGTLSGSTITWIFAATGGTQTGEVWFLTRVNGSVSVGSVLTNVTTAASATAGTVTSNTAQVNVGSGGFTLQKSQSANSIASGGTVNYTLNYQVSGASLQSSDSYGNNAVNTTNASILGFDGSTFTYTNTGGQGGFTVQTDAQGNSYIRACASNTCNSSVTLNNYPTLLRNGPPVSLCANFMAAGDVQIPAGSAPGADATLVIADNLSAPGVNDAYMLGISLDNGPGNFFLQKNQSPASVSFPATLPNASIGTNITAGVWYSVKVLVSYNAGQLIFQAKVWPRGTLEPGAWSLNYTDNSPLPCVPLNSGTYQMGFQADGSSSTNYYANLRLYGPSPVINPSLWDTLPPELSFVSSVPAPTTQTGNYLEWDLGGAQPVTTYNLTGSILLTAAVTCGNPSVNTAFISSSGAVSTVSSNAVTLTITGCNTATATATSTPTPAVTSTATSTPTITSTPTPAIPDLFVVDANSYNIVSSNPVSIFVSCPYFPGDYSLKVYNTAGEEVRVLDTRTLTASYSATTYWDGKNNFGDPCASGVYILHLIEPLKLQWKKIVLIR